MRESRWSPCLYSYFKAALYSQLGEQLTAAEREEQLCLMERVPQLKQRIAGKSLPMEKFAIKKAEKFKIQVAAYVFFIIIIYLYWFFLLLLLSLVIILILSNSIIIIIIIIKIIITVLFVKLLLSGLPNGGGPGDGSGDGSGW